MMRVLVAVAVMCLTMDILCPSVHSLQPWMDEEVSVLTKKLSKLDSKVAGLENDMTMSKNAIQYQKEVVNKLQSSDSSRNKTLKAIQKEMSNGCETGRVYIYDWPDVEIDADQVIDRFRQVSFAKPFKHTPAISLGITLLDSVKERNLRVRCEDVNVTTSGFQIKCTTWFNSRLWGVGVSWIAC